MSIRAIIHDDKLRERALKEFVHSIQTGRMIAVTGAMSTQALGYPSWKEFTTAYADISIDVAAQTKKIIEDWNNINKVSHNSNPEITLLNDILIKSYSLKTMSFENIDVRVAMWTIHELFKQVDSMRKRYRLSVVIDKNYQESVVEIFDRRISHIFLSRTLCSHPRPSAIYPLISSLGINRFATLNYDLELERALMLRLDEQDILSESDRDIYSKKTNVDFVRKNYSDILSSSIMRFIGNAESGKPILNVQHNEFSDFYRGKLSRTMANGNNVESDIVDRERSDRLFEFAVGSADVARHVIHLHGRADKPKSLVANIKQYDHLYRLDDLHREPFEHGMRVLFGGNPILFIGISMKEPELNRTLEYFVSNAPMQRSAPMFLLWNTNSIDAKSRPDYMSQRRLDYMSRLGVHILFDEDIELAPSVSTTAESAVPLKDSEAEKNNLIDRLVKLRSAMEQEDVNGGVSASPKPSAHLISAMDDAISLISNQNRSSSTSLDKTNLQALADTIAKLPRVVAKIDKRINRQDKWRTVISRIREEKPPHRLWGTTALKKLVDRQPGDPEIEAFSSPILPSAHCRLVFLASTSGTGRGEFGERLLRMAPTDIAIGGAQIIQTEVEDRLLINASFSYDSDAMHVGIYDFLRARCTDNALKDEGCRERLFSSGIIFQKCRPSLIIINGCDQFFSFDGTPLSAELDLFLRSVNNCDGNIQVVILGTERLLPYCSLLGSTLHYRNPNLSTDKFSGFVEFDLEFEEEHKDVKSIKRKDNQNGLDQEKLNSSYLDWVARNFRERAPKSLNETIKEKNIERKKSGDALLDAAERETLLERMIITNADRARIKRAIKLDRGAINKVFFDAHLSPSILRGLRVKCPAAFEILRAFCFIGSPIELAVLLHVPRVRAILAESDEGTGVVDDGVLWNELLKIVFDLRRLGLILQMDSHNYFGDIPRSDPDRPNTYKKNGLWFRFALHRSLATYLRDKHGAPINDAKLSTTFNLSLFMSEPSDNYSPESNGRDELGDLVDSLIGSWHEVPNFYTKSDYDLPVDMKIEDMSVEFDDLYIHPDERQGAFNALPARSSRVAASCLRAALSLVRGYYSTGSLLKLDYDDRRAPLDGLGALTEHARRLDRLIEGFGNISVSRKLVREMFERSDDDKKRQRALGQMGSDPFYADDLVWLHNERGVVALAQGHLFDARDSFSAALAVNNEYVEPSYHGHSWRRISLNVVATRIERGSLRPAERLLDRIDAAINNSSLVDEGSTDGKSRVHLIRDIFENQITPPIRGTKYYSREDMLVVAMTTSYRGLIAQMRGRYHDAKTLYEIGVKMLRQLGEQRAFAHFQRHYASLQRFIGEKESAQREIEYSIAAAQSAKQMDVLHRARIVRADIWRGNSSDPAIRRHALQDLKDALRYATQCDSHRVRIEASASLARHMRQGGDYDTALRYATDALTTASRYGHSLQKTALRIEIGQILIARGDPISGHALLDKAIAIGTAKGHHQALERVRRARNNLAANPPMYNRTDIILSR